MNISSLTVRQVLIVVLSIIEIQHSHGIGLACLIALAVLATTRR